MVSYLYDHSSPLFLLITWTSPLSSLLSPPFRNVPYLLMMSIEDVSLSVTLKMFLYFALVVYQESLLQIGQLLTCYCDITRHETCPLKDAAPEMGHSKTSVQASKTAVTALKLLHTNSCNKYIKSGKCWKQIHELPERGKNCIFKLCLLYVSQ